MTWQQIVFRWFECAAAGATLLLAAQIAVGRLRQPADRINLILITFAVAAVVPVLVSLAPLPGWHLGLVGGQPADATPVVDIRQPPVSPSIVRQPASESPTISEVTTQHAASGARGLGSTSSAAATRTRLSFNRWWPAAICLLASYGLAAGYFIAEWLAAARRLRRLAARAWPADAMLHDLWTQISEGRGKRVQLLVSSETATPLVYGSRRTTLLIPDAIAGGEPSTLR